MGLQQPQGAEGKEVFPPLQMSNTGIMSEEEASGSQISYIIHPKRHPALCVIRVSISVWYYVCDQCRGFHQLHTSVFTLRNHLREMSSGYENARPLLKASSSFLCRNSWQQMEPHWNGRRGLQGLNLAPTFLSLTSSPFFDGVFLLAISSPSASPRSLKWFPHPRKYTRPADENSSRVRLHTCF